MVTWRDPSKVKSPLALETSLAGLIVVGEDIRYTSAEVATATTLTANHYFVKVTSGVTITLPPAVNHKDRVYTVMNIGGSILLQATSGDTINGVPSIRLDTKYSFASVISDANEWLIIGGIDVSLEALLDRFLTQQVDILAKLLVKIAEIEKHEADSSEADLDQEEIEEELKDLVPEVSD